ncbi:hypothetical protein, partial [Bosea sp. TAF32]|uniref:hypothetical protein n=1 Tax=Bosea sp. TAF32 TaxID=3237482 RepID=UPI003F8EF7E0
ASKEWSLMFCRVFGVADIDHENDQADRAISTGKLNALLRLHTRPINVVVFSNLAPATKHKNPSQTAAGFCV